MDMNRDTEGGNVLIRSEWNGDSLTVYLDGEIDHCASEHWRQKIEAELKKRPVSKLVLGFSDVSFYGQLRRWVLIGAGIKP